MRNFKELKIWQKGFDIAVKSFKLTSGFPKEKKYGMVSQITRAAVSIPSTSQKEAVGIAKKIIVVLLKFRWAQVLN